MKNPIKRIKEKWDSYSDEMKAEKRKELIKIVCAISATIITFVGLLISIRALGISRESLNVSEKVREDNKTIQRLDLEPEIYFYATLKEDKRINIVPNFIIGNRGPVEAVQMEIQFMNHCYSTASGTVGFSVTDTGEHWSIDELFPLDYLSYTVPNFFLNVNARVCKPLDHNIIEVRILYRRNPDRKLFVKRAFYFISPEGTWVPENSSSLKSDIYSKMKQELLETYDGDFFNIPGNILHNVNVGTKEFK